MKNLFAVVFREIRRISGSFPLMFVSFLGPILSFIIITWLFSAGVVREIPIAVVDNDMTALSKKIIRLCDATSVAKIKYYECNLNEAEKLIKQGKANAILFIPKNTEKKLLRIEQANIRLYLNNSNLVKSGILKSGLYKTLATISTGIKIQIAQKSGATAKQAFEKSLPISIKNKPLFNPFTNYAYYLGLALLPLMLTIFIFLSSVYVLGIELKEGTIKKLIKTSGNKPFIALLGKYIPYTLIFMINAIIMNYFLFKFIHIPIKGNITAILISEFFLILIYQTIALLFLTITTNMRLSLSLGSAYTMMAITFAGVTFPIMAMPQPAQWFSYVFPYTLWIETFIEQSIKGIPLHYTLHHYACICIYLAIGLIAIPGILRKMTNPIYWKKH